MEHHAPASQSEDKYKLPNQPFSDWLNDHTTLYLSKVFGQILGVVYFLAALIYYTHLNDPLREYLTAKAIQLMIDFAHLGFISVFIWVLFKARDYNEEGSYRVRRVYHRIFNERLSRAKAQDLLKGSQTQLRRFKDYFIWFWIGMMALYITFALKHLLSSHASPQSQPPDELIVWFNHVLLPFFHFNEFGDAFKFLLFPFLTFMFNNLTLMFAFWCFLVLYLPSHSEESEKKRKVHINRSIFAVIMLTLLYPIILFTLQSDEGISVHKLTTYATVFDGFSGLLNAVVLALLIARMDSKLIGLRSGLIGVLYFYSAVQPLFVVFEQPDPIFESIQTFVLIVVFISKIYFFYIIHYALQTGRVLNYLFCFPFLNQRVNSIFDNQFEIETHREKENAFSFLIREGKTKVYATDTTSKTKEECDERVKALRERVKQKGAFQTRNICGTYWVQIITPDDELICESKPLKSDEEAKDLIEVSKEKIPYCKFNRS